MLSLRLSIYTFIQERATDFSTEIFTGKRETHKFENEDYANAKCIYKLILVWLRQTAMIGGMG